MSRSTAVAVALALALVASLPSSARGPAEPAPLPSKRISVLVLTGENETDWRWTSTFLHRSLVESGKFSVELALFPAGTLANPWDLERFDVIVVDYSGPRWGSPGDENFLAAVEGGTGVVAIHHGALTFPDWKEYTELLGLDPGEARCDPGRFGELDVAFPELATGEAHPITAGVASWRQNDVLIEGVTVAEGRDVLATARAEGGAPVPAMVAGTYGAGRVVATTLGHVGPGDPDTWVAHDGPLGQMLLLRAVEWAATGAVTPLTKVEPNTLTEADRAAGWKLLFDGRSGTGWESSIGMDPDRWRVEGGRLVVYPDADDPGAGGDIRVAEAFDEFELELDWRVDPSAGGDYGLQVGGAGPELGFGGAYDPTALGDVDQSLRILRPAGQWNHVRIVARWDHVEHWLNGVRLMTFHTSAAEWAQRVQAGNIERDPTYARTPAAQIALSGGSASIYFRNMKIRRPELERVPGDVPAGDATSHLARKASADSTVWVPQVVDNSDPAFAFADGELHCNGWPLGFLRGKRKHVNYELELEWRYDPVTRQVGEGGVLLFFQNDDVWPRSIEVDLMYTRVGWIQTNFAYPIETERRRQVGDRTRAIRDMERRPGEWNHMRIRVDEGQLTVWVNGEVVNAGTVESVEGYVGLKAEGGGAIHYREVQLTSLD